MLQQAMLHQSNQQLHLYILQIQYRMQFKYSLIKYLYLNLTLSMSQKILSRDTQFFAKNYKQFSQDLSQDKIPLKNPPFIQLFLTCCGYGYFPKYKDQMIENLIAYLKAAIHYCKELTTLKIIFNGFDVDDEQIPKICEAILSTQQRSRTKRIQTLWIHTGHLRKCRIKDMQEIFDIIDKFGMEITSEEISIQMADWEFQKFYPTYQELMNAFVLLEKNMMGQRHFRRFRLEMSSWYMREKQAYAFLKDTLDFKAIRQCFLGSQHEQSPSNSQNRIATASKIKEEDRQATLLSLDTYLEDIDELYLFPPLPNLPDKKDIESYHKAQQQRKAMRSKHQQLRSKLKQSQQKISSTLMKFPLEYVNQLRVDEFHKNMKQAIAHLISKMQRLEDFQIDMRNWHPMFNLAALKKQLNTQINQNKKEFAASRITSIRIAKNEQQSMPQERERQQKQPMLKTTYIM